MSMTRIQRARIRRAVRRGRLLRRRLPTCPPRGWRVVSEWRRTVGATRRMPPGRQVSMAEAMDHAVRQAVAEIREENRDCNNVASGTIRVYGIKETP